MAGYSRPDVARRRTPPAIKHVSNISLYSLDVVRGVVFSKARSPPRRFCRRLGPGEKRRNWQTWKSAYSRQLSLEIQASSGREMVS